MTPRRLREADERRLDQLAGSRVRAARRRDGCDSTDALPYVESDAGHSMKRARWRSTTVDGAEDDEGPEARGVGFFTSLHK